MKTKRCSTCWEDKSCDQFYKNIQNKTDGLRPRCKSCTKISNGDKFKTKDPKPGQKTINMVGERFGLLTVISYVGLNKNQNKLWECLCDCGNTTLVTTTQLRQGRTTSCKCNQYKKGKDMYNYTGYHDITGTKWNSIKNNAESRNLCFEIKKEDVWLILNKQENKCVLSGLNISFKDGTASIDRIDNNCGYTIDNIWLVHKDINLMRNKFSVEYFKYMCELVANN